MKVQDDVDSAPRSPEDETASTSERAAHSDPVRAIVARSMQKAEGRIHWTDLIVGLILLAALGLVVHDWYAMSNASPEVSSGTAAPTLMSQSQLSSLQASAGHSLYWAGAQDLSDYEVTITGRDVAVRYLPTGSAAGAATNYLTVTTRPVMDAYASLTAQKHLGSRAQSLPGGALLVAPPDKPFAVVFGFPGHDLLMEVYDPVPGEAWRLVTSGQIQTVPTQ